MPTLGFLKKKKAKEHDSNSPTSPVDNSPVTPTSFGGYRGSLTSTSANTLSSTNSSNKGGETMLASHTAPQLTSAPRSAGQEPLVPQSQYHDSTQTKNQTDPSKIDSSVQSQPDDQTNGSNIKPVPTTSTNTSQPAAARTTKGKYTLTDFTLKRTLGTGSFGRVHLVQSNHNQRFYAIKVLKKAQVVRMKQVEHTNDERKMLQKVKHAFLVTLWGTFQDSKNLYMVMDFVEGGELFSLLRKSQVSDLDFFQVPTYHLYLHRIHSLISRKAVSKSSGQVLCCRSHSCSRLPTLSRHYLPRFEA